MKAHNCVRVADVEIVFPERDTEWLQLIIRENKTFIGYAVLVRVAQNDDLAGRRRIGEKDVAVWRQRHPAWPLKTAFRKSADLESRRQVQLRAFRSWNHFRPIGYLVLKFWLRQIGRLDLVMRKGATADCGRRRGR